MNAENLSLKRLSENEAVFRRYNEEAQQGLDDLTDAADRHAGYRGILPDVDPLVLQFYCECSDENCHQRFSMAVSDYRRIHTDRSRFIIIPGHQAAGAENVVEKHKEYYVVKKYITPPERPTRLHKTDIDNV